MNINIDGEFKDFSYFDAYELGLQHNFRVLLNLPEVLK